LAEKLINGLSSSPADRVFAPIEVPGSDFRLLRLFLRDECRSLVFEFSHTLARLALDLLTPEFQGGDFLTILCAPPISATLQIGKGALLFGNLAFELSHTLTGPSLDLLTPQFQSGDFRTIVCLTPISVTFHIGRCSPLILELTFQRSHALDGFAPQFQGGDFAIRSTFQRGEVAVLGDELSH
jgi:hypothetical protein